MYSGIVLTSAPTVDYLESCIRAEKWNILKVVTGWGLTWNSQTIPQVLAMTDRTIVRTVAGDGLSEHPYPNWERVLSEVAPFYAYRKSNLFIEIGNEPKTDDIEGYCWHLEKALTMCRTSFPWAQLISPALSPVDIPRFSLNTRWQKDIQLFDYIGVHQYAHYDLRDDDTGHARLADRFIPKIKPWALTEYGTHDTLKTSQREKVIQYRQFSHSLPAHYKIATAYHLCTNPQDEDQEAYALELKYLG